MGQITHRHHIIPKYMGGSNDPTNLVEVTITQHAMFHYCNWRLWGNEEDEFAWKTLSKQLTKEEVIYRTLSLAGKKGGKKAYEMKIGIHSQTLKDKKEYSKKGGQKCKELGLGVYALTMEQKSENGKKGARSTNSQRWKCLETSFITTPGNLSKYQKKRGIDTSKRIRIE